MLLQNICMLCLRAAVFLAFPSAHTHALAWRSLGFRIYFCRTEPATTGQALIIGNNTLHLHLVPHHDDGLHINQHCAEVECSSVTVPDAL